MAVVTSTYPQFDSRTLDTALVLADTQTVTQVEGSKALTVASATNILDVGASHFKGDAVWDISTVAADGNDEQYLLMVQGSNSATFASGVFNLGVLVLGAAEVTGETVDDVGDGRYIVPFSNAKEGTVYRYLRGYIKAAGATFSIIINGGWISPRN